MKCSHCNKEMTGSEEMRAVLINCDGDFVHDTCEEPYKKARDHFFNVVIHDDAKFEAWLGESVCQK